MATQGTDGSERLEQHYREMALAHTINIVGNGALIPWLRRKGWRFAANYLVMGSVISGGLLPFYVSRYLALRSERKAREAGA